MTEKAGLFRRLALHKTKRSSFLSSLDSARLKRARSIILRPSSIPVTASKCLLRAPWLLCGWRHGARYWRAGYYHDRYYNGGYYPYDSPFFGDFPFPLPITVPRILKRSPTNAQ
jgi:hypothetical protein